MANPAPNSELLTPQVEQAFKRLMKKDPDGLLRPEEVVEAAKSPSSPLHNMFDWDDTEAAEKWRLHQAGVIIRSFSIVTEPLNVRVRALTSLDIDRSNGGGYRWTIETLQKPQLREQLLQTALHELESVRRRYEHIEELSQVWRSIDAAAEAEAQPAGKLKVAPAH